MRAEVLGLRAGMIMDEPGGWKALSRETDVRKYAHPHGGDASGGLWREEIRPRLVDGVHDEIGRGANAGEAAQVFVDDQPERPGERHVVGEDGDELRFRLGDETREDAQAGPRDGRLELGDQVGAFELRIDGADGAEVVQFRRVEQIVDVADELVLRQIGGVRISGALSRYEREA